MRGNGSWCGNGTRRTRLPWPLVWYSPARVPIHASFGSASVMARIRVPGRAASGRSGSGRRPARRVASGAIRSMPWSASATHKRPLWSVMKAEAEISGKPTPSKMVLKVRLRGSWVSTPRSLATHTRPLRSRHSAATRSLARLTATAGRCVMRRWMPVASNSITPSP